MNCFVSAFFLLSLAHGIRVDGADDGIDVLSSLPASLQRLVDGNITHVVAGPGGEVLENPDVARTLILPGSFNPIHRGHEEMAKAAANATGFDPDRVLFEIAIRNADKGEVDLHNIEQRVNLIVQRGHRAVVTTATLFFQKADLFPGSAFAVGYDTYVRIVDPKYYCPLSTKEECESADVEAKQSWVIGALRQLQEKNIRLAVAGRVGDDEEFQEVTAADLEFLPAELRSPVVPVRNFRLDLSSSEIRKKAEAQK